MLIILTSKCVLFRFKGGIVEYVAYYVDALGVKMKTQDELIEVQFKCR